MERLYTCEIYGTFVRRASRKASREEYAIRKNP
ncbi:hypothetical protein NIES4073_31660 [Kalymmatonema gypsitolerans NIES-4073]|nr:hypothetical protein NIES4073_31660 [Scytonema sp. NIES-4073]